jgi:phosphate transport system permease protein
VDRIGTGLTWVIASAVLVLLVAILTILLKRGLPQISWHFLTARPSELEAGGGVGPEIWNTLYLLVVSTAVTAPIGIAAGLYLARYARPGRFTSIVRFSAETLSTLPTIVYGLFGFALFVVTLRWGMSRLGGALTLSLLNLPLMLRLSEESLRRVPHELEEASLALGATRLQTVLRVVLPSAVPGLVTALILTAGRVFGESAPLLFTAGTTVAHRSPFGFQPFASGETLAVHLWYVNSEGLVPDAHAVAAGSAAVLILVVLIFNLIANAFAGSVARRLGGGRRGPT